MRARRRFRPTFRRQLACVLGGIVVPVAILYLAAGLALSLMAGLVLLAALWLAVELDLVPALLERWAMGHASASRARWFIDVEAEDRAIRERLRGDVGDNPAL